MGGVTVYPECCGCDSTGVLLFQTGTVRVGQIAYQELVDDIVGRREFYEGLGLELDETVREREAPAVFFKRLGLPEDPNKPTN